MALRAADGCVRPQRAWVKVDLKTQNFGAALPPHEVVIRNEGVTPAVIVNCSREVIFLMPPHPFNDLPAPSYRQGEHVVWTRLFGGGELGEKDGIEKFHGEAEIPEEMLSEFRDGRAGAIF